MYHEPIIDEEKFHLVQDKINNTQRISRTKRPREESYFCGVLYCKKCGGKFSTQNHPTKTDKNGKKIYRTSYRCTKKISHDEVTCTSPDIIHTKIELAFSEYIKNIPDLTEMENNKIKKERELREYAEECKKKIITTSKP